MAESTAEDWELTIPDTNLIRYKRRGGKAGGMWGVGGFSVDYDNTDHFYFKCEKCGEDGRVDQIEVGRVYRKEGELLLMVDVYCQKCDLTGSRKIYLDD